MKRVGNHRSIIVLAMLIPIALTGCFDECQTDADCDDGLWCNGVERCGHLHERGIGISFAPLDSRRICKANFVHPCCSIRGQACSLSYIGNPIAELVTDACSEVDQECKSYGECATDEDCSDGLLCTGDDFCTLGKCLVFPRDCPSGTVCVEPEPGDVLYCLDEKTGIVWEPTGGPPRYPE